MPPSRSSHCAARSRSLTLLLALVTALASLGLAGAAGAPAAGAAPGPASMQVRLTSVSPSVAVPGREVTVSGTIRNLGAQAVAKPVVRLRLTRTGLDTRGALASWADGSSQNGPGPEVGRTPIRTTVQPHASTSFAATIAKDQLPSGYRFTTFGLSVDVLDGSGAEIGSRESFLPYDGTPANSHLQPIDIGWVVPITLDGDAALFGVDSEERTKAWRHAIGPGSRIDRLVEATDHAPVTWAVDPTVVDPPVVHVALPPVPGPAPSTSSPPSSPPLSPSPPPASSSASPSPSSTSASPSQTLPTPAATPLAGVPALDPVASLTSALATRLQQASPAHPVWALPRADADLTALLDLGPAGGPGLNAALTHPAPSALGSTARSDIAWPIGARLDDDRLGALRDLWSGSGTALGAVVTSTTNLDGPTGYTGSAARRSALGTPLLAYDERLSGVFSSMSDPADGAASVQRFLAETLATYQERPAAARSLLVAPPRGFAGDPAVLRAVFAGVAEAHWLTPVATSELLASAARAVPEPPLTSTSAAQPGAPGELTAYPPAAASPLTAATVTHLATLRTAITGVSSVLATGQEFATVWGGVADQLVSSRWRGSDDAWRALRGGASRAVARIAQGVRVVPSTFNFFADAGALQLTVINELDVAVKDVRLDLAPRNPRLRILEQPEPLRIGADSRTTVRVRVNAISAGQVPVDATLSSANGTPIGKATQVTVRVQPTSTWIYWVLGIVAGLILALGLYRGLRRGPRHLHHPAQSLENPSP